MRKADRVCRTKRSTLAVFARRLFESPARVALRWTWKRFETTKLTAKGKRSPRKGLWARVQYKYSANDLQLQCAATRWQQLALQLAADGRRKPCVWDFHAGAGML